MEKSVKSAQSADAFSIYQIAHDKLTPEQYRAILELCSRVYGEPAGDFEPWAQQAVHFLGYLGERLVSHAMAVERWLQPAGHPPLRTAYVEAVATERSEQQRGFGTLIMHKLQSELVQGELGNYDLGGLSENPDFRFWYRRLGWESWRGPLFIRLQSSTEPELLPTDDHCMILRLPKTPPLDLDSSLSAEWRKGELW